MKNQHSFVKLNFIFIYNQIQTLLEICAIFLLNSCKFATSLLYFYPCQWPRKTENARRLWSISPMFQQFFEIVCFLKEIRVKIDCDNHPNIPFFHSEAEKNWTFLNTPDQTVNYLKFESSLLVVTLKIYGYSGLHGLRKLNLVSCR